MEQQKNRIIDRFLVQRRSSLSMTELQ